jgi:hypothetical protein
VFKKKIPFELMVKFVAFESTKNSNYLLYLRIFIFLPNSPYIETSALLKIWKVSACKIGHEVALFSEGSNHPANQPASRSPIWSDLSQILISSLGDQTKLYRYLK